MHTRRMIIVSLAGTVAAISASSAAPAVGSDMPTATLIPGEPPILDYGGGVKVPSNRDAFYTLWEGNTFWLTFGFGISPSVETAKSQAAKQASGVMKLLLLTLAFAPERLSKNDGNGWHKKDPKARDFVVGELELPNSPSRAISDAFLGGGNTEISPFWNWSNSGAPMPGTIRNGASVPSVQSGPPSNIRQANQHAFSNYIVLKSDLSLDDVRKRAVILQI